MGDKQKHCSFCKRELEKGEVFLSNSKITEDAMCVNCLSKAKTLLDTCVEHVIDFNTKVK